MDSTRAMIAELMSNTDRSAFFTSRLSQMVQLTAITMRFALCQHLIPITYMHEH